MPELADSSWPLVLSGRKTATCGALDPEEMPEASAAARWYSTARGRPAAVIETIEVVHCRFDEVDAAFAREEGEGDGSLA